MSLRLRLTLFYTLLVGVVLGLSGVALRLGLEQALRGTLDRSLVETVTLLKPLLSHSQEDDEGFHLDDSTLMRLPPEVSLLVASEQGQTLFSSGRIPSGLKVKTGYQQVGNWRVYGENLGNVYVLTLRPLESLEESLDRFDWLFLGIFPLAVLVALGLGYLLAKRALAPADALTQNAYALAQSGNWRQRLVEPKTQDELWRVARSVNTLLGSLSSVIERERRFTQDAAHELRTPLTVVRGRLERALETGDKEQIGQALKASDNLLGLVEKLLLLARADQGQTLSKEKLALDEKALEVAEDFQALYTEKGLTLDLDLPEQPIWVAADTIAIKLVIRNLLENALKFTPSGTVVLRVLSKNNEAQLLVEDSGPGIAPEALEHIFEPFFQTDVAHRRLGSGLGLALVARLVEQHGGKVWANNRTQGGSSIGFVLPLWDGSGAARS